jgi:hypothetical protein
MEASFEAEEAAINAERTIGTTGSEEGISSDLLAAGPELQQGLSNMSQYIPIIDSACSDSRLSDASTAQRLRTDSAVALKEVIPYEKSLSPAEL